MLILIFFPSWSSWPSVQSLDSPSFDDLIEVQKKLDQVGRLGQVPCFLGSARAWTWPSSPKFHTLSSLALTWNSKESSHGCTQKHTDKDEQISWNTVKRPRCRYLPVLHLSVWLCVNLWQNFLAFSSPEWIDDCTFRSRKPRVKTRMSILIFFTSWPSFPSVHILDSTSFDDLIEVHKTLTKLAELAKFHFLCGLRGPGLGRVRQSSTHSRPWLLPEIQKSSATDAHRNTQIKTSKSYEMHLKDPVAGIFQFCIYPCDSLLICGKTGLAHEMWARG